MVYSTYKEEFQIALERLRANFPMVCLKAWTPDDYEAVVRGEPADWSNEKHCHATRRLHALMKENDHLHWDMVREACRTAGLEGEAGATGATGGAGAEGGRMML
jgi:hypothetical protein